MAQAAQHLWHSCWKTGCRVRPTLDLGSILWSWLCEIFWGREREKNRDRERERERERVRNRERERMRNRERKREREREREKLAVPESSWRSWHAVCKRATANFTNPFQLIHATKEALVVSASEKQGLGLCVDSHDCSFCMLMATPWRHVATTFLRWPALIPVDGF